MDTKAGEGRSLSQIQDEIRRRSAELVRNMLETKADLRVLQEKLTPHQFSRLCLNELSLDERTLEDIFAFDGTMDGITERMVGWFMRSVERGRLS